MSDDVIIPATGETIATDEIGGTHYQRMKISIGADGSASDVAPSNPMPVIDAVLEIARGNTPGKVSVNKFGRSTNVDDSVDTDVWDRANATDDQDVWTAPTVARTHDIASDSANDTSAGTGARTIQVYGLTAWNTAETSEVVTMNGASNVATANSYVIIHRMKVLTWGTAGPNVGKITATAQVDSTVTAQINAGTGQTEMAIYGIPSTQTFYIYSYYASAIKTAIALSTEIKLLVNSYADNQLAGFITKHTNGLATEGSNYMRHVMHPPFAVAGPAIIKLQSNSSAADTDVSAGFDGILIDN